MATALITGATAGLGAEFARQLAERGTHLVLVARDAARLEATASALHLQYGVQVETLRADLADRAQVQTVADRLSDDTRPVDILINNAGFGTKSRLLDEDPAEHERSIDVMATAVLVLSGAAARAMKRRGRGRIMNVASLAAWITEGSYSAVKSFAKLYSEGLAIELADTGVTVTALCPGWVRTEFHDRAHMATSAIPDVVWVSAERCVRESLADLDAGKVISIPTKRWKIAACALDIAPRSLVRGIARRLTRSRA